MIDIMTVGDLRKLVAQLDAENVADDVPLAKPSGFGAEYQNGFGQVGMLELAIFGAGKESMAVSLELSKTDKVFKGLTPTKTVKVLAFD